jgi:hypothetical protein
MLVVIKITRLKVKRGIGEPIMGTALFLHLTQNPGPLIAWAIYSIGIVLSIMYRKANTRKFTFTLISFGIFLLDYLVSTVASVWIFQDVSADSMSQRMAYLDSLECISTPFWIIAWAMLLMALFKPESDLIEAI